MIEVIVALLLGQLSSCPSSATAALTSAAKRVAAFDVPGAITDLTPAASVCQGADVARHYLQGLVSARDAYRYGGSPESLAPVRAAASALEAHARESIPAEIARSVLLAASAAAQSEREEMALFLEQARDLERQVRGSGNDGAPLISAFEIAGDLWLQVHRFEDARAAYLEAVEQVGSTRRTTLGLARTAFRLNDLVSACDRYGALVADWPSSAGTPPELAEARAFVGRRDCRVATSSPRR